MKLLKKAGMILFVTISAACLSSCKTGFMADNNLLQCVNNMRHIETAKRTLSMAYSIDSGELLSREQVQELATYMTGGRWSAHQCASGGNYTVGRIGQTPECSIHGKLEDIRTYLK